jgi:BspA type Leucine rich repeat region (6 copies)
MSEELNYTTIPTLNNTLCVGDVIISTTESLSALDTALLDFSGNALFLDENGNVPLSALPLDIDSRISVLGGTTEELALETINEHEIVVNETIQQIGYGDENGDIIYSIPDDGGGLDLTLVVEADDSVLAYSLSAIPDGFKTNESTLKGLYIGNTVTEIGSLGANYSNGAFGFCSGLTGSLVIPNSVTSIGNYAFYICSLLTSVAIPDSVTSIGNYAFYNCSSLTSVTIPDSVITIGDYTFYNCSSSTSLTIPDSVTSIGNYAFYSCSSSTSLTIGNSVTSIGDGAFSYCSLLTSVAIPDSVTSIGNYAFSFCSSLTSVTIPDSVTSIGDYTFIVCTSLTSITIPDSVTTMGTHVFQDCSGLTEVNSYITRTLLNTTDTFLGCTLLTTIHARASDVTWTAGADTIGGKAVTVVKDL